MSSGITFSGFNSIDFNAVLNIMMTQEEIPRTTLAARQTTLKNQSTSLGTLSTKLATLGAAAGGLADGAAVSSRSAKSTDDTIVSASASSDSVLGTYEILVSKLAQSQVTTSSTQYDDSNTTVVADGGTLKIGAATVDVTGKSLTLQGLADAINGTEDIGVTATIVSPTTGKYQLVLTGNDTGAANSFTITNSLTQGGSASTLAFNGTNARTAGDAELTVNDVSIKSATNTVSGAVPGTTLTLHRKSTDTVGVTVARDTGATENLVQEFVDGYNALVTQLKAGTGTNSASADPLQRSMWAQLRAALNERYTAGGDYTSLASIGVRLDSTGKLTLDSAALTDALEANQTDVGRLFAGDGSNGGVFKGLETLIDSFSGTDGVIATNRQRIKDQVSRMDKQLADMDGRLANRRAALQKQFSAADSLMSQLNSQTGALSGLGSGYKLF
jgi:flagellar hook-associated protein 2